MKWNLTIAAAITCATLTCACAQPPSEAAKYPAPNPAWASENAGANVQRTMRLLATSTPELPHSVRILFYGQSITEQDWWKQVVADLERDYPHARILAENRAIGGFSSQLLVKTAETDVYPFYPDLVILHTYGSHVDYENLVRGIRSRTTAEILLQTDHLAAKDSLDEPTDSARMTPEQWTPWMNAVFLPSLAEKYGLELADQRRMWKEYLRAHRLAPSALLSDDVHLNEHGSYLMSQLVGMSLRYRPELARGGAGDEDAVREYRIGSDLAWRDGKLELAFEGNRIDGIFNAAGGKPLAVQIDDKNPADIPELYVRTRVTPFPDTTWPCLLRTTNQTPLEVEQWTIELHDVAADVSTFRFRVRGSKTGSDGEGSRNAKFVSKSGRVVIEPDDWTLDYARRVFRRSVRDGFQIQWRVVPQFLASVAPSASVDAHSGETIMIAQGLSPGRHLLKLSGGPQAALSAIRVYRPPLASDDARTAAKFHK